MHGKCTIFHTQNPKDLGKFLNYILPDFYVVLKVLITTSDVFLMALFPT